jgi:hypothetical protein
LDNKQKMAETTTNTFPSFDDNELRFDSRDRTTSTESANSVLSGSETILHRTRGNDTSSLDLHGSDSQDNGDTLPFHHEDDDQHYHDGQTTGTFNRDTRVIIMEPFDPPIPMMSSFSTGLRERTYTGGSVRSVGSTDSTNDIITSISFGNTSSPAPMNQPSIFSTKQKRSQQLDYQHSTNKRPRSRQLGITILEWIQTIDVSTSWLQRVGINATATTTTNNNASSSSSSFTSKTVPFITGLDRVVYGPYSCADAVSFFGGTIRPPRYVWYMISGFSCDIIQFCLDLLLHVGLGITDASTCWSISFTISIAFRHTTHRYLVFGNYVGGYYRSLIRMYTGYSVSIILSTIFNQLLTRSANIPHYVAYLFTLFWTGIVNYFMLKRLWSFGGSVTSSSTANS